MNLIVKPNYKFEILYYPKGIGFTEVYDLQGGIISWARDKNEIVK